MVVAAGTDRGAGETVRPVVFKKRRLVARPTQCAHCSLARVASNYCLQLNSQSPSGGNKHWTNYRIVCYDAVTASTERFCQNASVQRYFFTIRGRDRVEDDPDGTYLPDVAAALSYAESTIRKLRKKSGYNDLS